MEDRCCNTQEEISQVGFDKDYVLSKEFKSLCEKIVRSKGLFRYIDLVDDIISDVWQTAPHQYAASTIIYNKIKWMLSSKNKIKYTHVECMNDLSTYKDTRYNDIIDHCNSCNYLTAHEKNLIKLKFSDCKSIDEIVKITENKKERIKRDIELIYRKIRKNYVYD